MNHKQVLVGNKKPVFINKVERPSILLQFNLPLQPNKIPQWRGAVAASAGWKKDLFHNHHPNKEQQNTFLHRYPLIQYRVKGGKAALWASGEGITAVKNWLSNTNLSAFKMNGRPAPLFITNMQEQNYPLAMANTFYTYRLMDWIALNGENYQQWRQLDRLTDRIELLEQVLRGQVISYATAHKWHIPESMELYLHNFREMRKVKVHGEDRIAFNVLFKSRLLLPPSIGLGRSVAFGFGVCEGVGW